jgi:hypothetical protein
MTYILLYMKRMQLILRLTLRELEKIWLVTVGLSFLVIAALAFAMKFKTIPFDTTSTKPPATRYNPLSQA